MSKSFAPGVVTGKDVQRLHQFAKEKGLAMPAVNVVGSNSINAVLETAAELNSPVIIQFLQRRSPIQCREGAVERRPAFGHSRARLPELIMCTPWPRNMGQ